MGEALVHWGYQKHTMDADGNYGEHEERFTLCGVHEKVLDFQFTFRNPKLVSCGECKKLLNNKGEYL